MFNLDETFSSIADRFQVWNRNKNSSTTITNIRKEYLNKAQRFIQMERSWEGLLKKTTLTVTDSSATLPSDFLSVKEMGYDEDADQRSEYQYYNRGMRGSGYRITNTFSKATGTTKTIKFYQGYPYDPNNFWYQYKLTDFEDSGTEYSYFPSELLLTCAQYLVTKDNKPGKNEKESYFIDYKRILKMYVSAAENQNPPLKREIVDAQGNVINLNSVSLTGKVTPARAWWRNSQDTTVG